jgi:hypothetical protein
LYYGTLSWSAQVVSDELERRAAYGARVHGQRVAARQREFTPRANAPEFNALASRALTDAVKTPGFHVDALVFLVTLLAVGLVGLLLRDDVKLAVIMGGAIAIPGAIATIIAASYRRARQLRRALHWFDTFPFAFDRRRYLELLGQERSGTSIEMQIAFTATPTAQDMELFANAASGSAAIAHRQSHGNILQLTSVPLRTHLRNPGTEMSTFPNNQQVHTWMLSVIDGALRLIHERYPIERVTVKMESVSIAD